MTYTSRWISTHERLPETPGFYLTTVLVEDITDDDDETPTRYGTIDISFFNSAGRWSDWDSEDVTAWMPLPDPYHDPRKNLKHKIPIEDLKRKIDEFNNKKEEDT